MLRNVLLFIMFVQSSSYGSQTVLKDHFLFNVSSHVYSLNDLKSYHVQSRALRCLYPDALFSKVFPGFFSDESLKYFVYSEKIRGPQKKFFKDFVRFIKIMDYSKTYPNSLSENFKKNLLKNNKVSCKKIAFRSDQSFLPKFEQVLKLELFLRSRFTSKTNKKIDKNIVENARQFVRNQSSQIQHELYW